MHAELVWIDLREPTLYQQGHFSRSINLSWTYLNACLNALPERTQPLGLVAPNELIEPARNHLLNKGYQIQAVKSAQAMQQPGLLLQSGINSFKAWAANPFLMQVLSQVHPKKKLALDLGCGGGRDAIYLGQQGWQVTAIDQQARVLDCAKQLAKQHQAKVDWIQADLRQPESWPLGQFDLIMMIRFLDRDLFSFMRSHCRVGGYVLVQTFIEGVERYGSPKNPNFILRVGELAKEFSEFDLIVDRIDELNDGRPVASFLARRKEGMI